MLRDHSAGSDNAYMFIRLWELTSASCQSMVHIAIYVNLYTRIRAVRPSTCTAFGHLIRAPHYFETLGWIGFIYGLMIGIGPKFFSVPSHPHPWPEGQGHGLGSLQLLKYHFQMKVFDQ